jgi:hypothetical protein
MRTTLTIGVTAVAVIVASCGGGGVSQAEYDQKLAELALAQQQLVAAGETIAELEGRAVGADDALAIVEAAVLEALGLRGIAADPGRDRVELLAEAVRATTEERDMLLEAVESGGGGELGPTVDVDLIEGSLRIASAVQDWARPSMRPQSTDDMESLRQVVDQVGDEMVTLAYEQLLADYDRADDGDQVDLLMALGYWAVETAGVSVIR